MWVRAVPAALLACSPKRAASAAVLVGAKLAQGSSAGSRGSSTQYCTHGVSSTSSGVGK